MTIHDTNQVSVSLFSASPAIRRLSLMALSLLSLLLLPLAGCGSAGSAGRENQDETSETRTETAETHVIGVYESRRDHSGGYHPTGETDVEIGATDAPVILVLSSYEPTQWNLSGEIDSIQEVIVTGYHSQIVTGIDPSLVEFHTFVDTGDYLFGEFRYVFDESADDYLSDVEDYTGTAVVSAQGDYTSVGFYKVGVRTETAETHVIGVYESRRDHSGGYHPTGETDVEIGATDAPVILVLSSYEPTQWNLSGEIDSIQEVIVTGYHSQIVTGIDPSLVEFHTLVDTGDYLFGEFRYVFDESADDYLSDVEDYTGTAVVSAQGDYTSVGFYKVGVRTETAETHVIGVYESRRDHSGGYHPTGETDVEIGATDAPVILVLSSYEPTQWNLSGEIDSVQEVIVTGYHSQIVTGIDPDLVDLHSYEDTRDYLFGEFRYVFDESADDYLSDVEDYTGTAVVSAQGDYTSVGFYEVGAF